MLFFAGRASWNELGRGLLGGRGWPGTSNVRPFAALCQLALLKASEFPVLSRHELLCFFEKKRLCQRADNNGVFAGYACHMWACYVAYTAAFHESSVAWLVAHPTTKLKLVRELVHWDFYCHEKYITYCIYSVYFFFCLCCQVHKWMGRGLSVAPMLGALSTVWQEVGVIL